MIIALTITERLGHVGMAVLIILGLIVLMLIATLVAGVGNWLYSDGGSVCFVLWLLAGGAALLGYIFDAHALMVGGFIAGGVLLALGIFGYMFDA